jgi:hypothetical protein
VLLSVISTSKVGTEMSGNVASAKSNVTEPSTPTPAAVPTGYRVAVVPGALEVSARLGTPEEVRNLMKVLRAGIAEVPRRGKALRSVEAVPYDLDRVWCWRCRHRLCGFRALAASRKSRTHHQHDGQDRFQANRTYL